MIWYARESSAAVSSRVACLPCGFGVVICDSNFLPLDGLSSLHYNIYRCQFDDLDDDILDADADQPDLLDLAWRLVATLHAALRSLDSSSSTPRSVSLAKDLSGDLCRCSKGKMSIA